MAWRAFWLMVLGAAVAMPGIGAALAESRVALVIGNADYRHARALPNPRNDAEAIAKLLHGIGFAEGDVILKLDLEYVAMREAVRRFASKASTADVAIVYYAGHGIEVGGENYLVPIDAKLTRDRDLEYEAVTLASILDAVSDARKLKLVILDACRDNPLSHKIALKSGVTRKVARGLERIEPQGDVLVAYAAKAGTVALDGEGRHSPFAEALLKHLPTPGIDVYRLFGRVKETVLEATGRQQEPHVYGSPGGEPIALVPETKKASTTLPLKLDLPPPPPPPPSGAPPPADGLSATEAVRICREVAGIASLSVLGALAEQHKETTAGPCIAARMDELTKAAADRAKAEKAPDQAKAASAKKTEQKFELASPAPPKATEPSPPKSPGPTPTSAPETECDRLAAPPGYSPPGVAGVPQDRLDAFRAIAACREALARYPTEVRLMGWLGRSLKKAEHYGEALQWLEKAAGKGEVTSMTNLGWLYQNGKGVAQDYARARFWYEKGAEAGEPTAMANLAVIHRDALGVPRDYAKARHWFALAAEKGNLYATNYLGVLHFSGLGGPLDYAKAHSWFARAAEKGEPVAMFNLGVTYKDGKGVAQDYAKARAWWEKAAERGSLPAMTELGVLYQNGLGVPQSYTIARLWYEKAAAREHPGAMNRLGFFFHMGHGVPQDYTIARSWYEKAMAKGDNTAMRNLAVLYASGLGVPRSPQAAARYLLGAAKWGNATTRRDLDDAMQPWSQEIRVAVQQMLIQSGDYRGPPHGYWDQASRDAAKAYYLRRQ